MYKIQHFGIKLCKCDTHCLEDCDAYSIWRLCPSRRLESFKLFGTSVCTEWFSWIYWLILMISAFGFFYSCYEFLSIYYGSWKLSTYRERKYRLIPMVFRRNVRLIGSACMAKSWASLFFGIAAVTPSTISLWLTIFFVIFCFEIIHWIWEILFGVIKLDIGSVCSHCMFLGTLALVRCVRDSFVRMIDRYGDVDELKLMPNVLR